LTNVKEVKKELQYCQEQDLGGSIQYDPFYIQMIQNGQGNFTRGIGPNESPFHYPTYTHNSE